MSACEALTKDKLIVAFREIGMASDDSETPRTEAAQIRGKVFTERKPGNNRSVKRKRTTLESAAPGIADRDDEPLCRGWTPRISPSRFPLAAKAQKPLMPLKTLGSGAESQDLETVQTSEGPKSLASVRHLSISR